MCWGGGTLQSVLYRFHKAALDNPETIFVQKTPLMSREREVISTGWGAPFVSNGADFITGNVGFGQASLTGAEDKLLLTGAEEI